MERVLIYKEVYKNLPKEFKKIARNYIWDFVCGWYEECGEDDYRPTKRSPEVDQYLDEHVFTFSLDEFDRLHVDWEGRY